MPFLRSDSNLNDTPGTNLLTRNPFLIFRLVLLALSGNLAFLSLTFAAWNINASLSANLSVPSTSVFVIFESCLFFICVTLALAEFFRPKGRISYTAIECCWVGVLSLFQTGAAISSTIDGPALACHSSANWAVCASSLLLVPSTWLSSIFSLTYFLALFVTIMAHKSLYPDIWTRTIYTIEWFGQPQDRVSKEKIVQDFFRGRPSSKSDPFQEYYEDIESTAGRKKLYAIRNSVEELTPWAPPLNVRRGIDHPFTRPQGQTSNASSPIKPALNLTLPSFPDRSATIGTAGSRYLEKFRESTVLSRPESSKQFTKHYHAHNNSFALSVADLDKPIPLPRLSEWIRADSSL
ncbi:hypothetical protein GALMADRAFT_239506 [Galerina marginata CBS 339.88]|uniref:Uncharacterized protein n=1 Tax=Galerina marginata (strain CBS 339.88) TaxID=685588 RepID=A0A067TGQ6_GALM3|nr:hypothetical protein GALMADRAFT_239506 [Galerina marginata CBS 339.88]